MTSLRIIVVGGGRFLGGNSTKATSGINGALTRSQVDLNINDSVNQFYDDTLKSARENARPDLIRALTYQSAAAIEWLQDVFNLDLTLVSRLGGHSVPRTHRGHDAKFPGMAIAYALMQRAEDLCESEPERFQVIKKAEVSSLNKDGDLITGVTYEYDTDFTENSLLKRHRPDTSDLSSANGTHATGDGHKMLMEIGASDVDMDKVQVHPTGLIDPKHPGSKWKFLAAEALRGEGGILLNSDGQRFCDDLGHRDYVSGKMWEEKERDRWPIRLVLNSRASNVLKFHTRHYSGRGLMKKMTGRELAREIGCGEAALDKQFKEYNAIANGEKKDPWGKKYFHNVPIDIDDDFHVALMEPVLHFTMGGMEINDRAQVLNREQKPFEALFACGELAGSVHGANRLGGSSLLCCVVFGRVAGASASQYLLQKLSAGDVTGTSQRLGQISLHIDPSNPGKVSVQWGSGNSGSNIDPLNTTRQAQNSAAPVMDGDKSQGDPGMKKETNDLNSFKVPEELFSLEEVAKHNKKDDLWIAVKDVVMDVTNWLEDHPGGPQALFSHMGKDATEEFAMLRDDEVIPKYAASIVIGRVEGRKIELKY